MRRRVPGRRLGPLGWLLLCVALCTAGGAYAEGSGDLYPANSPLNRYRASIEWRNSTWGGAIPRRTLFYAFMQQGEVVLLGSSAMSVGGAPDNGDIQLFRPGRVSGRPARENIPATADFSCREQRDAQGPATRGRIASRAQELAGPNSDDPGGYIPCTYVAQESGIHAIALYGPAGRDTDDDTPPSGNIDAVAADFGPGQGGSITAWDLSVRANLAAPEIRGRVFTYYIAASTGSSGRDVTGTIYIATRDGFIYSRLLDGDPFGFLIYANRFGFLDTDGTPLYHAVIADLTVNDFQQQNQLARLQGGVTLDLPYHPIFLATPDVQTLQALGIPINPAYPNVTNLTFEGPGGDNVTEVDEGGTFRFASNNIGFYEIVISRDGVNFDPEHPRNRALYGEINSGQGLAEVTWDGRDNEGQSFLIGRYAVRSRVKGGEVHFPSLDVENSYYGASVLTLINPPGGACPGLNGGCHTAFYNDTGYRTASGVLVGTEVGGPLCPGNVGNPPQIPASDQTLGYDTRTTQRAWGFQSGGVGQRPCDPVGGFGDMKGLDTWTYYPSAAILAELLIVEPLAVDLARFTASAGAQGVTVSWETSTEVNTFAFELYRSATGDRARAERVTDAPILARGRGGSGAAYSWLDEAAEPGVAYSYWLREIESGGAVHEYGPARATPAQPTQTFRLVLPLVLS